MLTKKDITRINWLHRAQDDSDKWPIRGRFNVTERAIRQARKIAAEYGLLSAVEYDALLDLLESAIVNNPKNW